MKTKRIKRIVRRRLSPKFTINDNVQAVISGMPFSDMEQLLTCAFLYQYEALKRSTEKLEKAKQSGNQKEIERAEEHDRFHRQRLEIFRMLDESKKKNLQRHNRRWMNQPELTPQPETREEFKERLKENDRIRKIINDSLLETYEP